MCGSYLQMAGQGNANHGVVALTMEPQDDDELLAMEESTRGSRHTKLGASKLTDIWRMKKNIHQKELFKVGDFLT